MVLAEIIRSCSHAKVADLLRDVERRARARGLAAGPFVAQAVQAFARSASHSDWRRLAVHIEGSDMPVLSGLLHILETTFIDQGSAERARSGGAAHMPFNRDGVALSSLCH